MKLKSNYESMKINISTEIIGRQPSEEVQNKLLDTINALWIDFDTVPELQSKVEVDIFGFIFRFTMEAKSYKYDGKDLHIILTYTLTDEEL